MQLAIPAPVTKTAGRMSAREFRAFEADRAKGEGVAIEA
jgi:hypothetical protein